MATLRMHTALAAESIGDDGVQWIELMPVGEKLRNGRFYFTITDDDLETYAESIRAKGDQTPIDYDHSYAEGKGTRAAGWFTGKAEVRGEGEQARLWAEVQWTAAAVEAIKSREYRFVSPEFSFEKKDAKTGLMTKAKEILANTLTNRPFFDELAALAAEGDLVWRPNEGYAFLQQKVYAALNPGGYENARYWVTDIAVGKALVEEHRTATTWVVPFSIAGDEVEISASSDWIEAKTEWVAAANDAAAALAKGRRPATEGDKMDPKVIRAALGLPETATDDEVTAALTAQKEQADKTAALETELETLKASAEDGGEVGTLRDDLAAERTKRVTGERAAVLAEGVRKGQIVPASKDALVAQFGGDHPTDDDLEKLQAVIASFPEKTYDESGHGNPANTTGEKGAIALEIAGGDKDVEKVDDAEVDAHTRALAILTERGKTPEDEDAYVLAYEQAERELAVAG